MNPKIKPILNPQAPRKFYFLDYIYILLKGVSLSNNQDKIFDHFLDMKYQFRLGESKYKKITEEPTDSSESKYKMVKYRYTFNQVLSEANDYKLIKQENSAITLTRDGVNALNIYDNKGSIEFNCFLFKWMEEKHQFPFRYLIETCYKINQKNAGLLIFPIYSANRLGFERDSLRTGGDLIKYFQALQKRMEDDLLKNLGKKLDLSEHNGLLVNLLVKEGLLPVIQTEEFDSSKSTYNAIMQRSRDFWLKIFLREIYSFKFSLDSFEIWAYRAKQIGLLHITEFYPDPLLYGKIAYPLSVIKPNMNSIDFKLFYEYSDGMKLYLHQPSIVVEDKQHSFAKLLHEKYVEARSTAKTYFVNLLNVKERVCYAMKIPEHLFDKFLSYSYHKKDLRIRISLEVDNKRQPKELSGLDYIRREPVMIDGKPRNIIAIDLA
jgi:hypothetical protein